MEESGTRNKKEHRWSFKTASRPKMGSLPIATCLDGMEERDVDSLVGTDDSSFGSQKDEFIWVVPTAKRKSFQVPPMLKASRGFESAVGKIQGAPDVAGDNFKITADFEFNPVNADFFETIASTTSSRRQSLPMGATRLQEKMRRLRRVSDLFSADRSREETKGHKVLTTATRPPEKLKVMHGWLCVMDANEIQLIPENEKIIHLLYGDGQTEFNSHPGLPEELPKLLVKTPTVETLELRGYWDFSKGQTGMLEYLQTFPRLPYLTCLILPKTGLMLDKMGSILVGYFGQQLKILEAPAEFLEGTCPEDLSKLLPVLKHLQIFNSTLQVMSNLIKLSCDSLETLIIGQFRHSSETVVGIPWEMLKRVVCKFGQQLVKFQYSFPVVDDKGEMLEDSDVEMVLKKYLLVN